MEHNKRSKPSIVFADHVYMTDEALKLISDVGEIIWSECKSVDELVKLLHQRDPYVIVSEYFPITGQIMDVSRSLRGIVTYGVGYDHIDVDAASERGIYVANAQGANSESVAEHTFGLILALTRRILRADRFIREGKWVSREEVGLPEWIVSQDLYGKTIGIIGFGNIGSRVARIARGFGMKILAYDPYVPPEKIEKAGGKSVGLRDLLKSSDIVTLHCVLSDETRGLIGDEEFDLMKPTAYIINASRGPVIVESALIRALEEGKIAGAGLDVFEKEPINPDNPLLKFSNVVVTPHSAGGSKEALDAVSLTVSEEVVRIVRGEVPKNLVNKEQLEEKGFKL